MAKSLAAERGINLADVAGTGPDGRITAADVENHKAGSGAPKADKAEKKKDEGPKIGEPACLPCVVISAAFHKFFS
jgi:pyruvate dehydrogenase E2 component (dihydrolipoamide acetyltransferase)